MPKNPKIERKSADELNQAELEKVKFLDNLMATVYNAKVKTDKKAGTVSVDMTPAELNSMVNTEATLMQLRRKVNGISDD